MATLVTMQQDVIQISKQELFDTLTTTNPTEFTGKTFNDVETIEEDADDASFIKFTFKKVTV